MPATISWFLQDRILIYRLSGNVTLEELSAAWAQGRAYRDVATDGQVHALCDVSEVEEAPLKLNTITNAMRLSLLHSKQGWVIVYNVRDCLIPMIIRIVTRSLGVPFHTAENEAAALDFLNTVDATLPPLRPLIAQANDQKQAAD